MEAEIKNRFAYKKRSVHKKKIKINVTKSQGFLKQ